MRATSAQVRMRVRVVSDSPCNGIFTDLVAEPYVRGPAVHVPNLKLFGVRLEEGTYAVTFEKEDGDVR